jgi:hypothetical protein
MSVQCSVFGAQGRKYPISNFQLPMSNYRIQEIGVRRMPAGIRHQRAEVSTPVPDT